MKAHDAAIQILDGEGVDVVFSLMSEDTMSMMSKMEEHWSESIRQIKTRHEQGAMAMADGYARATDRIGVCIVGRGPAISQTGNGMVTARKKGSDLLVVVPEPPLSAEYDIKEFDQEGYLRSTIGNVTSIRSHDTFVHDFRDAIRRVKTGGGPLAVQIPWDLLDSEMPASTDIGDETAEDAFPPENENARLHPDDGLVSEAVDIYVDSDAFQPPIILAGRGAVQADAKDAIEELAERTSGLLATSLQGRNYFADHPYYLGFTGSWGTNLANQYASEAHVVFAVGASLNSYTIDEGHVFGDHTQVIHVDRDPAPIGRNADIDLGIQGDARTTVEAINAELERRDIDREGDLWTENLRRQIEESQPMNDREYSELPGTVDPRELVVSLNELLPEDKKVVVDGGHFTRWCMDGIHVPPEDFTFTLDFASIGLGLPMGVGTAIASDKPCVAICGDAGFLMSIQELETAIRQEVPMTIVVVNDSSLGSEYHSMAAKGVTPDVALISTPDFADVAESLGAEGETVRTIDELESLSDELGSERDGPLVVDCKVNYQVRHRSKT